MRRAGLPLAYTQGFHPGPKIQIASALPLGFSGRAEVVDLWLNETGEKISHSYKDLLQSAAPPGLILLQVEEVDERAPALQTQVVAAEYEITFLEAGPGRRPEPVEGSELPERIADLLAKSSLPRERRGKAYDLRPLILSLECRDLSMRMVLSAREGATGRPEEVLAELGLPVEAARIERTRLILKDEVE